MRTYKEIGEEAVPFSKEHSICGLAWCPDGQILTVATVAGDVFNFLARTPTVHASSGPRVAYLSSLREVSVVDASRSGDKPLGVPVSIEPTIVALGPSHVAVAMNDRVIFYRASVKDRSQVRESNVVRLSRYTEICATICLGTDAVVQSLASVMLFIFGRLGSSVQEMERMPFTNYQRRKPMSAWMFMTYYILHILCFFLSNIGACRVAAGDSTCTCTFHFMPLD